MIGLIINLIAGLIVGLIQLAIAFESVLGVIIVITVLLVLASKIKMKKARK